MSPETAGRWAFRAFAFAVVVGFISTALRLVGADEWSVFCARLCVSGTTFGALFWWIGQP